MAPSVWVVFCHLDWRSPTSVKLAWLNKKIYKVYGDDSDPSEFWEMFAKNVTYNMTFILK